YYRMLQRRGDSVPANADMLEVPARDKAILLEGIYRSRLNRQPPAEWAEFDSEERHAQMRTALLSSWADSQALARRLAQRRAAQIKQYLVEQGQLASERVYLMDVTLVDAETDGRIPTTLHLGAERGCDEQVACRSVTTDGQRGCKRRHHALRQQAGLGR